jgi:hypothetical protein
VWIMVRLKTECARLPNGSDLSEIAVPTKLKTSGISAAHFPPE